jgi:hypothetical protein
MSFQLMAWASDQVTGSPTKKAVLLALANAANHHTGECFPSVARLCDETEFGSTAVKNALASLERDGFVRRERRRRSDGSLGTYTYVFPHVDRAADLGTPDGQPETPDVPRPETAPVPRPETRGVSRNLEVPNRDVSPYGETQGARATAVVTRVGWKVDKRPVTDDEERVAREVLAAWNREARQALAAQSWLAKIVMRCREHPELTVADHEELIRRTLSDPWWRGTPSPSVVYGNDAIFERAMAAARSAAPAERALDIAEAAINEARRGLA